MKNVNNSHKEDLNGKMHFHATLSSHGK